MNALNPVWPARSVPAPTVLQPRALCESLAERLRERILRHEFAPGQFIDETALIAQYGVSRTPVREALKLLQHEGLLTARPRRGMFVTVLQPQELREAERLYQLLHDQLRAQAPEAPGALARRLLALTEQQLRLALGPGFEPAPRPARAAG